MQFRFDKDVVRVNTPSPEALLPRVRERLAEGKGMTLATLNLDHLVKLRTDPAFRAAYAAHDLIVADGNPIVWLSRLARRPVRLAPGSDMVTPLARAAAHTGAGIALVGSAPAVLATAADRLTRAITGLQIVTQLSPEMGFDPEGPEADWLIDEIADSEARFCFLALGAPVQEIFAARARARLPDVAFASVGAGLDFIAGAQTRAPLWVRRMAMEWLWRALGSPFRLGPRYARCLAILPGEIWAALRLRSAAQQDTALRKAILGMPDQETPRIPAKLERALVPLPKRPARPARTRLLPILDSAPGRLLPDVKQ